MLESVGRYVIDCRIGQGAMADVYRAHDPSIGRVLAIKVLKQELRRDVGLAARFLREARAAGALSHPNIVTIYDVGEAGDIPYIAMELLEGVSLDEHLSAHGRMPVAEVARLGAQLADALDYAHRSGVIHRDIKPSNIMLADNGQTAKILDFGIARMNEADRTGAERHAAATQFGQVVGTPRYMSPEQAFGLELDNRSDLFSLGAVLYEAMTGTPVFRGTSLATLALQITQRKPDPLSRTLPGCPRGMQHLVDKLLAKEPAKRFTTGAAVAEALRRELEACQAPAEGRRGLSLQARLTLVTGAVIGVVLIASVWLILQRQYRTMEEMALTAGSVTTNFLASNVALRAAENAGLEAGQQDWAPVQAFIETASRDYGIQQIVMVDAAGIVRGASDQGLLGRPYRPAGAETALPGRRNQAVTMTAGEDFRFVQTILYAGRPFGSIAVVVSGEELKAAAAGSRNLLIGLSTALFGVVLLLSYLIGRSITGPLRKLKRSLDEAARGNGDLRISHNRRDEFGALYDAFNALADRPQTFMASAPTASLDETRIAMPALPPPLARERAA